MKQGEPTVLLVHSDPDAIPPLFGGMSEAGYRMATFTAPRAASAFAGQNRPDLILTAIDFPEVDGLEYVQHLRAASPESAIFVLAPARPWPSVDDVFAAGGDALLTGKPSLGRVL